MKSYFRYFGILALLFFALFFAQRHLFLAFGHIQLKGISTAEIMACHAHALWMDLSTIGYILLPAVLLAIPSLFSDRPRLRKAIHIYLIAVILFSALVNVADIGLFDAWGTKLDHRALSFLRDPQEVMHAGSLGRTMLLLLVATVESLFFIFLLNKIDRNRSFRGESKGTRIAAAVLMPAICMIALRGGMQEQPINKSSMWCSPHPVLDQAALNSVWNVIEITAQPAGSSSDPYSFMPSAKSDTLFTEDHQRTGTGRSPF